MSRYHTRLLAIAALVTAIACLVGSASAPRRDWRANLDADELELAGNAGAVPDSKKPELTAFFPALTYRQGSRASLVIDDTAPAVSLQVLRAGADFTPVASDDVMTGKPVAGVRRIGPVHGHTVVTVPLGRGWPSGVYFVRLTAPGQRVGHAPFVLTPRRLGRHRVAIVVPTQTWQAYNYRDDDANGVPDTWYAAGSTARLSRPFLDRGVPPRYKDYDCPFLRWATLTHHGADYLSDAVLNRVGGEQLRKAYELLVFEGHHEYVSEHAYDAVTRYRDLGGNLMFLSANNFYWKITIANGVMTRVARWRDLGRPEAALIGVQYYFNDEGEHRGAWVVKPAAGRLGWAGLRVGSKLSSGGIEADDVVAASPRSVRILAAIPNLYGDGRDAEMTYYETRAGAKVFAAGAFTLAGSVWEDDVRGLIERLWARLAKD